MNIWENLKKLCRMVLEALTWADSVEQSLPGNAYSGKDPDLTKISNETGISWQAKRQKWIVQVRDKGVRRTIGRQFFYDDAIALKRAWEELTPA